MLIMKYLLMSLGLEMFALAAMLTLNNLLLLVYYRKHPLGVPVGDQPPVDVELPRTPRLKWDFIRKLAIAACIPTLLAISIEIAPGGDACERESCLQGRRPRAETLMSFAGNPKPCRSNSRRGLGRTEPAGKM